MIFSEYFNQQVTVIGAGTMGSGITERFLAHGWRVNLVDISTSQLDAARQSIQHRLEIDQAARLNTVADPGQLEPEGFVIESVPEDTQLKIKILTDIERRLSPQLLSSNTSSLSISEMQATLQRPERFLGLHFFQPVPASQLLEVIHGAQTSSQILETGVQCAEAISLRPLVVKDSPGFATSRLGVAIGLEAMRMVEEEVASVEDIDAGMHMVYGHATGPLKMSDMVGLDVRLAISEHLTNVMGDRFAPPKILYEMVEQGLLGRKTGQGFFKWPEK